jgi:hypothetical protein
MLTEIRKHLLYELNKLTKNEIVKEKNPVQPLDKA